MSSCLFGLMVKPETLLALALNARPLNTICLEGSTGGVEEGWYRKQAPG